MISCGEPSGDLYAGALAREILRLDPSTVDHRLRQRAAPARRREPGRRLRGAVGHRPAGSRARAAAHLRRLPPADRRRDGAEARRVRRHRLSRLQFPPRARDAEARRPGRLLHQPAAVGLAAGADEDDAADRRSRAGHLSVRRRDLPARGRPGRVGRPSAARRRRTAPEPRAEFLARLGLDPARPVVALLPGSRINEVRAILPGLLAAARIIHAAPAGRTVRAGARAASTGRAVRQSRPTTVCRSSRSRMRPTTCWRRPTSRCWRRAR